MNEVITAKAPAWSEVLGRFARGIDPGKSFLALDLDGTALLEDNGKGFISSSVEKGVQAIDELGIPIFVTLRFPLSVMSTIGEAWHQIAGAPILKILLNGSVLG